MDGDCGVVATFPARLRILCILSYCDLFLTILLPLLGFRRLKTFKLFFVTPLHFL